jgi:hypothetical protein
MKRQKLRLTILGAAVALAAVLLLTLQRTSVQPTRSAAPQPPTATVHAATAQPPLTSNESQMSEVRVKRSEIVVEQAPVVTKIRADQVLATVNNRPIMGRDLVPVSAGAEQAMTHEMYGLLLNLAIERELIFQAAKTEGVELTQEQKNQIAEFRSSQQPHDGDGVFKRLDMQGSLDDEIAWEARDAESKFILTSLMAKAGAESPYVTEEQAQQYYQTHKDEFGEMPTEPAERQSVWQEIDLRIRQKLAQEVQAEYERRSRELLDQLKASAKIDKAG